MTADFFFAWSRISANFGIKENNKILKMPKKMGENSKSSEARERKANEKKTVQEKAKKQAEDKLWEDDDKNLAKKKNKKEEEERKKAEQIRKKAEAKALLESEMASIQTTAKQSIQKVTRSQLVEEITKRNENIIAAMTPKVESKITNKDPLEENLNRIIGVSSVASNIDEAIAVLSVKGDEDDRHPEKRMKAAYKAFEAENMKKIKAENPTMRMSQWKQMLHKEWTKSPENPINA